MSYNNFSTWETRILAAAQAPTVQETTLANIFRLKPPIDQRTFTCPGSRFTEASRVKLTLQTTLKAMLTLYTKFCFMISLEVTCCRVSSCHCGVYFRRRCLRREPQLRCLLHISHIAYLSSVWSLGMSQTRLFLLLL